MLITYRIFTSSTDIEYYGEFGKDDDLLSSIILSEEERYIGIFYMIGIHVIGSFEPHSSRIVKCGNIGTYGLTGTGSEIETCEGGRFYQL